MMWVRAVRMASASAGRVSDMVTRSGDSSYRRFADCPGKPGRIRDPAAEVCGATASAGRELMRAQAF
jgi:hypothetical protein